MLGEDVLFCTGDIVIDWPTGGTLEETLSREWLASNGLGGYAAGTLCGALTRRYHGLFVAALNPPVERQILVSKIEESIFCCGQTFDLGTNLWQGDSQPSPRGFQFLKQFRYQRGLCVWVYRFLEDSLEIEKHLFWEHQTHKLHVFYRITKIPQHLSPQDVKIRAHVFLNCRDFHALNHPSGLNWTIDAAYDGVLCEHPQLETQILFLKPQYWQIQNEPPLVYSNYFLPVEAERGFDHTENHLRALVFEGTFTLQKDVSLTMGLYQKQIFFREQEKSIKNTQTNSVLYKFVETLNRQQKLCAHFVRQIPPNIPIPPWVQTLVLAADAFFVERRIPRLENGQEVFFKGSSLLAGYPWFNDWGRDSFISLPGLCCVTGRFQEARQILASYALFEKAGLLPNCFADRAQDEVSLNRSSVDAPLWYIEALAYYLKWTHDVSLLETLFPVVLSIVTHYQAGTLYNIHADPQDGLLFAGFENSQLTWMDAKVCGRSVTPRIGKPIEVNVLWYQALKNTIDWAETLNVALEPIIRETFVICHNNFNRFWSPAGYAYDVLDGPAGSDDSLRPNQLLWACSRDVPITLEQRAGIVRACEKHLLTPWGLRSLAPFEPNYSARYLGSPEARDQAYHQGTSWAWWFGPYARAYALTTGDTQATLDLLGGIASHLREGCIGFISEISDATTHAPQGAFAQAWSVGEYLRAWQEVACDGFLRQEASWSY